MEQAGHGIGQYVILRAGLDTFAQRRPEIASRLLVFEVDQPGPQAWKRQRLVELGFGIPEWLRLVPVDFEAGGAWRERLAAEGFEAGKPAVLASTPVSMYLTRDASAATLRPIAALAPRSTLAMTFLLPLELADPEVRPGLQLAEKGARASGTPFLSYFTPMDADTPCVSTKEPLRATPSPGAPDRLCRNTVRAVAVYGLRERRQNPLRNRTHWADHPEHHQDELKPPADFAEHRDRIGGLLLLPKSFNASYGDLSFEDKLPHYDTQNLLARSLHPLCYDNNPGFLASGLPFKANEHFKSADLEERENLYRLLAERIWDPDDLLKAQ